MRLELSGKWKWGFALDIHTISSVKTANGFDNTYTKIGSLLHAIKYDMSLGIDEKKQKSLQLASIMANEIRSLKVFNCLNVIIPVPFSKQRDFQPVYFIADAIAYYVDKPIDFNYIHKKTILWS